MLYSMILVLLSPCYPLLLRVHVLVLYNRTNYYILAHCVLPSSHRAYMLWKSHTVQSAALHYIAMGATNSIQPQANL